MDEDAAEQRYEDGLSGSNGIYISQFAETNLHIIADIFPNIQSMTK